MPPQAYLLRPTTPIGRMMRCCGIRLPTSAPACRTSPARPATRRPCSPEASWRYDELTGSAIEERKWALGFASGSSGAMQWDWAREADFGIERSDGSAKLWESMMQQLGTFARQAAPYV